MAKSQKMSAKQRQARIDAAKRREETARAQREHKERMKKIGIIIVCVILVLALGLPTVALSFLTAGA